MLTGAAVCPQPPLLIPAATGAPGPRDAELERLRIACHQAVADLLSEGPDLVAVVGGAAYTAQYPPDAPGSLREFGIPFTVGGPRPPGSSGPSGLSDPTGTAGSTDTPGPLDPAGSAVLPLALTVGKWLLSRAAGPVPAVWWGIASDAPAARCLDLGERLAALAPRVALLVLGDGPGRRTRGVPGAVDADADRYDDQVATALAGADAAALAALDPGADSRLFVAGRAAWQVLAGAAGRDAFAGDLRYRAVPFEVTYLVARWRRR
jgi:hypothetical protein